MEWSSVKMYMNGVELNGLKSLLYNDQNKFTMNTKCVTLLSGGQDSTTCLYWAIQKFGKENVEAIGFNYGQSHIQEQIQAQKICKDAGVEFKIIDVRGLLSGSSLTNPSLDHNEKHPQDAGVPASFTAGRNLLFLTVAASYGYNKGVFNIVTGVCQTDYSGYFDCRREFIDSTEQTLKFATNKNFFIHTPLMYITKAETFKMAKDLGVAYTALGQDVTVLEVILNDTLTDYNGDTTVNEWGLGINNNPATALRVKGFYEAKEKGWL